MEDKGYDTKSLRKRMYKIGWNEAIKEFENMVDEIDKKYEFISFGGTVSMIKDKLKQMEIK